ncbi:MAG: hypothetical protein WKF75_11010 [Singulisphaera sp.]
MVAWSSIGQDGSGDGVYARRFNAAGSALGAEFRNNVVTPGDQNDPIVAVASDGSFFVAWTSNGQDGSGSGVYARRYDSAGLPLGGEFRVNQQTANSQMYPEVAVNSSGEVVVAWASNGQDGSGWGVYARRYDAAGTPLGNEFRANTYTTSDQSYPSVATTTYGGFMVSWASRQDKDASWGILAQLYDADGSPQGEEILVQMTSFAEQHYPSIAMNELGHVVVAWSGNGRSSMESPTVRASTSSGSPPGWRG